MKRLFQEAPQDMITWILPEARFNAVVSTELSGEPINADYLFDVTIEEAQCLLHIEFQRNRDSKMAERLWKYNVRATLQYECPVWSCVIYLKKGSDVTEPRLIRPFPGKRRVHQFEFDVIRLWEIPTRELKEKGLAGLLPLLVLTEEGARREVVEDAIAGLTPLGEEPKRELLMLTYGFASLMLENSNDQEWLLWRFSMLEDILSETRAFQEIERKGLEKGIKQGLKEGMREGLKEGMREGLKEGELQTRRRTILDIVQERFPELVAMAREQVEASSDADLLRQVIVKVSVAQTADEAEQHLLALVRDDKRN
jgi:predicted transposase YdaD